MVEVLGFSDVIASGNPTPYYDPIVSTTSTTLTSFGDSDFLLEEVDAFLALEDDPTSPEVDQSYFHPEEDILLLEEFLNDYPSLPPPTQGNYMPQNFSMIIHHYPLPLKETICLKFERNLKFMKPKLINLQLMSLPRLNLRSYLPISNTHFWKVKMPVIIAKDFSVEEKAALITFLKSHKRAIAWKLFDIKGIDPEFCTHKILMEDDFKPTVQHQRKVNPKIYDVIKQEVLKLLDARLIYPIPDSPWEKSHFMVKEGIVLGHKISKNGIEVDKAKVDVIAKLRCPTTVKGAVLRQHQEKHFRPIHYASKTMTEAELNYTTTEKEMKPLTFSRRATMDPPRDIMARTTLPRRGGGGCYAAAGGKGGGKAATAALAFWRLPWLVVLAGEAGG
nr:reverse transcriptase domain-containing protein [Tanacetum cinerariifolium]